MTGVSSTNLSHTIIEYITKKIITMEYKPGDKIVESNIAKEFNISHSPVREALRGLERSWLIELIPRKGAFVTDLVEQKIESLFEIMTELLVLVMKKINKNAEYTDISILKSIAESALSAAKANDTSTYYEQIIKFGVTSLSHCNDPLLEQLIFDLLSGFRRILYLSFSFYESDLSENVLLLVTGADSVLNNDPETAETVLRQWMTIEKENSINGLKKAGLLK